MAPGAPRGKRKVTRGGGKNFSKNLRPLDADDADVQAEGEGMWSDPRDPKATVESSEEESSEEDEGASKRELTREERKAADKARKKAAVAQKAATTPAPGDLPSEEEEEEVEEAPKKPVRGAGGISVTNPNSAGVVESTLNRKEREAVEAAAAKERYWKLQEQGKTDQARADMARLAIIRQERDEKAKQRKAELEEKKTASEEKVKSSGRKK
ncbi:hypothetical protein Q9L58_002894 [Maublancomyces gigas]|uniref:Casein kinase substrate phosphoprotein PP28 domain-containing protein n=1 Tax=Discina gigas TaxID=1032678 RepID=A0ABR3GQA7_9PEZI